MGELTEGQPNDIAGNMGEAAMEKFLGLVGDTAKPCVTKAIDYTLLVFLLLLQFMRCSPTTAAELYERAQNQNIDQTTFNDIYSCDAGDKSSILYSSDPIINGLVLTSIVIGILHGIMLGCAVWIHSSRAGKDVEIHPLVEELYKCTDKLIMIDSAIEIPISFFWAPLMTLFLWSFFALSVVGLFLFSTLYNATVPDDKSAQAVFTSSAILIVLSLYQLTGSVSQYWVMYKASVSKESRDKYKEGLKAKESAVSAIQEIM
jgi:multisubunit Na+/H+ antiporter MnhC subunit